MPDYVVRSLNGTPEELPCLIQIEDECAAIYFNIIHGPRLRRRFTTAGYGEPCSDYRLVARHYDADGSAAEREIELYEFHSDQETSPWPVTYTTKS
jgi:hypothetical protein